MLHIGVSLVHRLKKAYGVKQVATETFDQLTANFSGKTQFSSQFLFSEYFMQVAKYLW